MPAPKEQPILHPSLNWSRRGVLIAGTLAAAGAFAKSPKNEPPRVLFVCKYGTTKSAIAREMFRQRAQARGIATVAFSRGLMLEDHISPPLRERLTAAGIDPAKDKPRVLRPKDWKKADIVVVFDPLPADTKPSDVRDWTDMPSMNQEYDKAKALMDQRIDSLLDEIAKRGH